MKSQETYKSGFEKERAREVPELDPQVGTGVKPTIFTPTNH